MNKIPGIATSGPSTRFELGKRTMGQNNLRDATIYITNRQDGTVGATTKRNVYCVIKYRDGSESGAKTVADQIDVGGQAIKTIQVPDLVASAVYFAWSETIDGQDLLRAAVFPRCDQYVGAKWDGAVLTFLGIGLEGAGSEYNYGGISAA